MNIQVSQKEHYLIVALQGRLDTTQADGVERQIQEILGQGHNKIIFDCMEMEYISSSGLRIFLIVQKKMMGSGGTLKICNLQPTIHEIFDMSGFSMIFSILPDLESALKE